MAEVLGRGVNGEAMDRCPEVELASGGTALEAPVAMGLQINPELTTG
jgi:hypothetical protein